MIQRQNPLNKFLESSKYHFQIRGWFRRKAASVKVTMISLKNTSCREPIKIYQWTTSCLNIATSPLFKGRSSLSGSSGGLGYRESYIVA